MTLGEFTKTDMYQFGDVIYLVDEDGCELDFPDDGSIDDREVIAWKKNKLEGSIEITIDNNADINEKQKESKKALYKITPKRNWDVEIEAENEFEAMLLLSIDLVEDMNYFFEAEIAEGR